MVRKARIIIPLAGMILGLFALEFRLYNIQVVNHSRYKKIADRQSVVVVHNDFKRGTIYDRNKKELALQVEVSSVYAVPRAISNPERVAGILAPLLGLGKEELLEKLRESDSFVWIRRKIPNEIGHKIEGMKLKGIGVVNEGKRFYPQNCLASQVIGLAGVDNQGLSGIEFSFDEFLRGGANKSKKNRDGLGRELIAEEISHLNKLSGYDIVTTIDGVIQYIAEAELSIACQQTRAKLGMIIVQDCATGEILSLACFPSFNANDPSEEKYRHLAIPAVSSIFEPGSTFKPIVASALLEEKVVKPEDVFYCENGTFLFRGIPIRDHEKEGRLTFAQIIEKSSNIGMVKVSQLLEKEKLYQYLRDFGFGNYTGIKLPGEVRGILEKPKDWTDILMSRITFGQGIGVTPIQLISAFSCIANGGILMEPLVVKRIVDSDGAVVEEFRPFPLRRVVSPRTAQVLTEILCNAVERGTGVNARVPGYKVAGKTGTAQKYDPAEGKYSDKSHLASFIGYLPADKPRVTILVMIDEPEGLYWGGSVAAPIFARVALRIMHRLGVPPEG